MWHLFPMPEGAGGGGVAGLEDVTGTFPIVVTALGTDRHITYDRAPSETGVGGIDRGIMGSMGRKRMGWAIPLENSTTAHQQAFTLNPAIATAVAIANTSYYASCVRGRWNTTAALNVVAGTLFQSSGNFRGAPQYTGGFDFEFIFGFHAANADSRFWCGLSNSSFAAGEPSAMASCIGFALDSGDTNIHFQHNDATGSCVRVDLGSGFPRPTVQTHVIYLNLRAEPAASSVEYFAQRMDDPTKIAYGSVGTNLPASTFGMEPRLQIGTGPTAAVICSIELMRMHCTTTL